MSKSYDIKIKVSDVGGTYTANDIEEARKIADEECNDIYARLKGRCSVEVESVTEINK